MKYWILGGLFFLIPALTFAYSYPNDSTQAHCELSSNGTTTCLTSGIYTLLNSNWLTSSNSVDASLWCDGTKIFDTHGSGSLNIPLQYLCNGNPIYANVSGLGAGKSAHFLLIYVPYDLSALPNASGSQSSSASTTQLYFDAEYTNILLILIAALLFIDLLRRLFASQTRPY